MIRPDDRTPEERRADAVDDARPSLTISEVMGKSGIQNNTEPPWEPLSFRPGFEPTEEMRAWLQETNRIVREKIQTDLQNQIIFGTMDIA